MREQALHYTRYGLSCPVCTVRLRWIGDSPQNPVGNPPKSTVEIRVEIYLYSSHFPLTCASYLYN